MGQRSKEREPCGVKGCTRKGIWHPVLELRAAENPGVPARAVVGVVACDACRTSDASKIIGDDGWAELVGTFLRAGKAEPARELTTVHYIHVDSAEAKNFRSMSRRA